MPPSDTTRLNLAVGIGVIIAAFVFFFSVTGARPSNQYAWMDLAFQPMNHFDSGYGQYFFGAVLAETITAIICIVGIGLTIGWLYKQNDRRVFIAVFVGALLLALYFVSRDQPENYGEWRVVGMPKGWRYINRYSEGSVRDLTAPFLANALCALPLVGFVAYILEQLRRGRLRWHAIVATLAAAIASYGLIMEHHGGGYEGWRGVPFRWYEWLDVGGARPLFASELAADVAIALVFVFGVSMIFQWLATQNRKTNWTVAILSLCMMAILLSRQIDYAGTTPYYGFGYYGAPFGWAIVHKHTHGQSSEFYSFYALLFSPLFSVTLIGGTSFVIRTMRDKFIHQGAERSA